MKLNYNFLKQNYNLLLSIVLVISCNKEFGNKTMGKKHSDELSMKPKTQMPKSFFEYKKLNDGYAAIQAKNYLKGKNFIMFRFYFGKLTNSKIRKEIYDDHIQNNETELLNINKENWSTIGLPKIYTNSELEKVFCINSVNNLDNIDTNEAFKGTDEATSSNEIKINEDSKDSPDNCNNLNNYKLTSGLKMKEFQKILNNHPNQSEEFSCSFNAASFILKLFNYNELYHTLVEMTIPSDPVNILIDQRNNIVQQFESLMPIGSKALLDKNDSSKNRLKTGLPPVYMKFTIDYLCEYLKQKNQLNKNIQNFNIKIYNYEEDSDKSRKNAENQMLKVIKLGGYILCYVYNGYWGWHCFAIVDINKDGQFVCVDGGRLVTKKVSNVLNHMNTYKFYDNNGNIKKQNQQEHKIFDNLVDVMNSIGSKDLKKYQIFKDVDTEFNPLYISKGYTFIGFEKKIIK